MSSLLPEVSNPPHNRTSSHSGSFTHRTGWRREALPDDLPASSKIQVDCWCEYHHLIPPTLFQTGELLTDQGDYWYVNRKEPDEPIVMDFGKEPPPVRMRARVLLPSPVASKTACLPATPSDRCLDLGDVSINAQSSCRDARFLVGSQENWREISERDKAEVERAYWRQKRHEGEMWGQ